MNLDPRTLAREEAEDEAAEREELITDITNAVKRLLINGDKKAAILLIQKAIPD